MISDFFKRTWAEIDLSAMEYNYDLLRSNVSADSKIMAVVKADAYGHGVKGIAGLLEQKGADWFAVSCLSEALELRHLEINKPILILGYTPPEFAELLVENQITQTVYSLEYAKSLSKVCVKNGITLSVHLKLDVGMGRLGFYALSEDQLKEASSCCSLEGLDINGIFTHFPVADSSNPKDREATLSQYQLFINAVEAIEKSGIKFKIRHCCNSAASMALKDASLEMVREGIAMYGLSPSNDMKGILPLKPAMALKTVVTNVKNFEKGRCVSYGQTFTADKDMRIATVGIGYADGYPRQLSNRGYMLLHSRKAPIVGRICMDQLMLDVTDIADVHIGDTVTVFGKDGGEELSVDTLSDMCGTINYELVCLIGKRVPRVYIKNNEVISVVDYIL